MDDGMGSVRAAVKEAGEWLAVSRAHGVIAWPLREGVENVCPECDTHLDDMAVDVRDLHMVRDGRILVACEGYYMPALLVAYEHWLGLSASGFRFDEGDRVQAADGRLGTVTEPGTRTVVLEWDPDVDGGGCTVEVPRDEVRHVLAQHPDD